MNMHFVRSDFDIAILRLVRGCVFRI
jgi:hypothetical protein